MKISDLIFNRVNRDYLLPSIQREFVWLNNPNDQKVEKLFDSILQNYPFGNILVWEVDKPLNTSSIQCEVYDFVKNYDKDSPRNELSNINGFTKLYLVLDGQQRISSLNVGLKGSFKQTRYGKQKEYKLYLNLFSDIENSLDNEYGLKYEFSFLDKIPDTDGELWFEVGRVLDYRDKNTEIFKEELDPIIRQKTSDANLITKAKMVLGTLHQAICVNDNLNITPITGDDEKALNVFVRTNDGGIKLEKSDLLLSFMEANKGIFTPNGARKEIFDFVDKVNKEEVKKPNYKIIKDDILKASLVLSNLEVQYKLKNFNSVNLQKISDDWEIIKKHYGQTLYLIAKYGFSNKNILSKNALIPIAYYLKSKSKSSSFINSQSVADLNEKKEIIKWLVISQLRGVFGSSSDSTLKSVRKAIQSGKEFKNLNQGKLVEREDVEKWVERENYGSRYSHLLLLLITEAKYWDDCHLDHIFPESKFNDEEYKNMELTKTQIDFFKKHKDSIANLHLLNPLVNIKKTNDDFVDWSNQQNKDFLKGSLIPQNINLDFRNFEEFIKKRKELLVNKIHTLLK